MNQQIAAWMRDYDLTFEEAIDTLVEFVVETGQRSACREFFNYTAEQKRSDDLEDT